MRTEDFTVANGNDWLVIPLTSTMTVVCNIGETKLAFRVGNDSTSRGLILNPSETVILDETVYLRIYEGVFIGAGAYSKESKVAVTR